VKAVDLLNAEPMACEQVVVWRWRQEEAKQAGMTKIEARMFAESDRDIGELRKMVAKGCPPELLAKVLL
jgi:hypothetical protein